MPVEETKWVETLAGIIALYGVFALVPLAIYVMRQNQVEYRTAIDETRRHCAAVHWVWIAATLLLMGAAGLFHFVRWRTTPVLWGSVSGLVDREGLKEELGALNVDEFYSTAQDQTSDDKRTEQYRFRWAMPDDGSVSYVKFRVRQTITRRPVDALADPLATPGSASTKEPAPIIRDKDFRLSLDSLPPLPKGKVKLAYGMPPNTPRDSLGVLMLQTAKGAVVLPTFTTDLASNALPPARTLGLLNQVLDAIVSSALAQNPTSSVSPAPPTSDRSAAKAIARGLHNDELSVQASAQRDLVESGSASCGYIMSALEDARSLSSSEKALLIHNLAGSLEQIIRRTPGTCRESYLPLAHAYYELNDFSSSAKFFGMVPSTDLRTPGDLYAKGYAYYWVGGRDREGIESFDAYLKQSQEAGGAVKAYLLQGRMRYRSGQKAAAIRDLHAAVKIDAPAWARAMAANDLAFFYSDEFASIPDSLQAALGLADVALSYTPGDPRFLDTKGWLLYQLGRCAQAEQYLERAARAEPNNLVIRNHLRAVRSSTPGACTS